MNEMEQMNTNVGIEDDWDDMDFSDLTDQEPEEKLPDWEGDDWPEPERGDPNVDEDGWPLTLETEEKSAPEPKEAETLTITYMGEEKTLTREEAVTLAQKGMNYDRVFRKLGEAQTELQRKNAHSSWLEGVARERGVNSENMTDVAQARALAGHTGRNMQDCFREVRRQRAEEARMAEARQRRDWEIQEFLRDYPEWKGTEFPPDVWNAVRGGESLLSAYRGYEIHQLKRQLEQREQQERQRRQRENNKKAAAGSMATRGSKAYDLFDELWYNGE